jgi:low affinity Fe/Cu permease
MEAGNSAGGRHLFNRFARACARATGKPVTFALALAVIVAWALTGPIFHYNDTWQLVINTSTTIITFLMIFLVQNTQNRESDAIQVKLDELIRSMKHAHNDMLNAESLTDEELRQLLEHYESLAKLAKKKHAARQH